MIAEKSDGAHGEDGRELVQTDGAHGVAKVVRAHDVEGLDRGWMWREGAGAR